MKKLFFIASRYLFYKNKKQAINILSFITMLAMACGTAALLVILSTFNGFESISKNLNEAFQPDLTVHSKRNNFFVLTEMQFEKLSKIQNIQQISKVLEQKVYLKYESNEALATIKGVDKNFFQTNEIKNYILAGDTILENQDYNFGLLGVGVAQKLNINLSNQFEQITIYYPKSSSNSSLGLQDNFELNYLTPGGVYSIYQDYDEKYLIAPLEFVQFLNNSNQNLISGLEIKLKDDNISLAQDQMKSILGANFQVKSKLELNQSFYKITRIEKLIVFFILSFILIILSFNFIGSLTMHIIEKEDDIKLLYRIGLKSKDIFNLYLIYGVLQGLIGGLIGLVFGGFICLIQHFFGLIKMPGSGTFVIQNYPIRIDVIDIFIILLILIFVSFLASLLPALKAKRDLNF